MGSDGLQDAPAWQRTGDGNCYAAAFRVLEQLPEHLRCHARLVHGLVVATGGPAEGLWIGHAWVELSGLVLDHSNGNAVHLPKPLYYEAGTIEESNVVRYTLEEAQREILNHHHWGPWHAAAWSEREPEQEVVKISAVA